MLLRRLSNSQRGSILILVAVAMFPMVGIMAFVIDVSHWFDYSRNLQNRADAAALAGGDVFGNICFNGSAGDKWTGNQSRIGKWAQLYSGPGTGESADDGGNPNANVPYDDAAVFSATGNGAYINVPNLKKGPLDHYYVRLNADNYFDKGGTDFAMGDFCNSDPAKDKTDKDPGPAGAMVDVKVTQYQLGNFIPIFGKIGPNIEAHARVEIQGLGQASKLRPLTVRDPAATPCLKVNFVNTSNGNTQTIILTKNAALTPPNGPDIWDNSNHNGGNGDSVTMPASANLYMQAVLYAQGASKDCSTASNPITYESGSGILYVDTYGTTAPTATQSPLLMGKGPSGGGGVALVNNTCAPDQYFNSGAACSVTVCAVVGFTPGASNQSVQVSLNGGANQNMTQGNVANACDATGITGATAWTKTLTISGAPNGQNLFTIKWSETVPAPVSPATRCQRQGGPGSPYNCNGTFGVQQESFAACNEVTDFTCNNYPDPNDSGPIVQSVISEPGVGSIIGSFQQSTQHNLIVRLSLQGLQDGAASDRCPNKCTVLRFGNGNADGSVDCGGGNSTANSRQTFLQGCPLFGDALCTDQPYCGTWIKSTDGSCNNQNGRATAFPVDCVDSNNNGATIPECVGALVQTGGTLDKSGDPCNAKTNNTGCSENHWISDGVINDGDPRIIDTFTVFPGDILDANGNTILPIRDFAAFYVTGWSTQGAGHNWDCSVDPNASHHNEPPPPGTPNVAIWGHWFSYVTPGFGNGQPCNFNQNFGTCTPVLTR